MLEQINVLVVFIDSAELLGYEVALLLRRGLLGLADKIQSLLRLVIATLDAFLALLLAVLATVLLDLHAVVEVVDVPFLLVEDVQTTVSAHAN